MLYSHCNTRFQQKSVVTKTMQLFLSLCKLSLYLLDMSSHFSLLPDLKQSYSDYTNKEKQCVSPLLLCVANFYI